MDAEETFEVEPVEEAEGGLPEPDPEDEFQLDPELAARRDAALAQIRRFGDPVLRTSARPIDRFDDALRDEIEHMTHLMTEALGVGLAATQVGVLNRLLVYRIVPDGPVAVLINPEVEWAGEEREPMEEGCLSLPGVLVDVDRPVHVRVRALDADGQEQLVEASGLEARVIQHEVDHLDGVLILDRTSREQRKEAIRLLRERAEAGSQAAA